MKWHPRGHTVLVEPDPQPETNETGLILPEDHFYVPTSGVVVAVGNGSRREKEIRQKAFRDALACVQDEASKRLISKVLNGQEPTHGVCVGDRVVFPAEAGLTIEDEGTQYILIDEDRIAVIVEEPV